MNSELIAPVVPPAMSCENVCCKKGTFVKYNTSDKRCVCQVSALVCTKAHTHTHTHLDTSNGRVASCSLWWSNNLLAPYLFFIHTFALGLVHPQHELPCCVCLFYFWTLCSLQWQRLNTAAGWDSNYAPAVFVFQASLSLFHQQHNVLFQVWMKDL